MMDRSPTKLQRDDALPTAVATRPDTGVDRRGFVARAASAVVGLAGASVALRSGARTATDPELQRALGAVLGGDGARSPHAELKRICGGGPGEAERACDIYSNNSKTPLQSLFGTVTPSDLHFERSHSGTPFLDPKVHRLLVHGLAAKPTVFTMDDLYRMPSVTRALSCSQPAPPGGDGSTSCRRVTAPCHSAPDGRRADARAAIRTCDRQAL